MPTLLKQDGLGRIVLTDIATGQVVRREACGGRWPGSRFVARLLLRQERRALAALAGLPDVPQLVGAASQSRDVLVRSFLPGEPLWAAAALPRNYFDLLDTLVAAVHARGVCHNDLHKENNILVQPDGRPALVDFQLATVHPHGGRSFTVRCREDLRHIAKHRRRYEGGDRSAAAACPPRSLLAALWMRCGKPLWNRLRRMAGVRHPEPRRPRGGPWPEWSPPREPRA